MTIYVHPIVAEAIALVVALGVVGIVAYGADLAFRGTRWY